MEGLTLLLGSAIICLGLSYSEKQKLKRKITKKNPISNSLKLILDFDVLVVGGGPAGSTASFYCAKNGLKVGLFDKKKFPRNKPCGDAWCAPALNLLSEMNILPKMEADGIVNAVQRGGFISPYGYECINRNGSAYGSVTGCKTYAIKREIADEYLLRAAGKEGTILYEGYEVENASFIQEENDEIGYWEVTVKSTEDSNITNTTTHPTPNNKTVYTTRLLFICDGSTSYLAQKLGIIPKGQVAQAVSSTCYITNHTWYDQADGVMIFTKAMLPGYSALFRHYNNDMYLGTYILPGGIANEKCISPYENNVLEAYPYIRDAAGKNYTWKKSRKIAPIRIGGISKPYDHLVLVIGDAAGHVDPLTGEGIHTAMIAGKIAGNIAYEMFMNTNFSQDACAAYAYQIYDAFVYEFAYSSIAAKLIYYFPITIDAMAIVGQQRGQPFLDFFGEVMTGVKPKSAFLQWDLVMDLSIELIRQIIIQYILRTPPLVPYEIGVDIVNQMARKK
jgi:menaquinone-9 beta-reductase